MLLARAAVEVAAMRQLRRPAGPGGGNAPPTIQGQPGTTVLAGQAYSFQPTATDRERRHADVLGCESAGLGCVQCRDRPTDRNADALRTSAPIRGITITVSDGTATASLSAVHDHGHAMSAAAARRCRGRRRPQNSDGSALTNLAGYRSPLRSQRDRADADDRDRPILRSPPTWSRI